MTVRRFTIPATVLAVAVLTLAPAALAREPSTRVVAFRSLGGVHLGWNPAQVKRRLGRPSTTTRVDHRIAEFDYYRTGMVVDFDNSVGGDPAENVTGNLARYRTSKGIHVGSTARATRHAYPSLRCDVGICNVYRGTPGAFHTRTLTFVIERGHVESLQVGEVFDH